MKGKKDHEKPTEREINSFVNSLTRAGLEFEIMEESAIKTNCGKGIYDGVKKALSRLKPEKLLLFVFREGKEAQSCWASKDCPGSVIINMACYFNPDEFIRAEKEAGERFREAIGVSED